jgi:carboxymethylenebutenolidase
VTGQRVRIAGGEQDTGGLLVTPPGAGPFPAVLVTTAIAGINQYVVEVAARLAGQGYVCLALDYYAREDGPPDLSTMDKILAAVAALPDADVLADVAAAAGFLEARAEVAPGRTGLVGFCVGGSYALLGAARLERVRCAVSFYGMLRYDAPNPRKPVAPLDAARDVRCPYLGHFGEDDHLVPLDDVAELRKRVSGRPAEVYTYPGAGHAFHEHVRPQVYRAVAAHDAWSRTIAFLDWHLRHPAGDG